MKRSAAVRDAEHTRQSEGEATQGKKAKGKKETRRSYADTQRAYIIHGKRTYHIVYRGVLRSIKYCNYVICGIQNVSSYDVIPVDVIV